MQGQAGAGCIKSPSSFNIWLRVERKPRSMCLLEWGERVAQIQASRLHDLALCRQPPTCLDAVLGGVGIEIDHPSLGTKVLETNDMVVPNHEADRCVTQFL